MITYVKFEKEKVPDQYIEGLGYITKAGENFLPAIIRLEEILDGTWKEREQNRSSEQMDTSSPAKTAKT